MNKSVEKGTYLFIATTFTGIGATLLAQGNYVVGSILLLLGAGVIALREYLKVH